MKKWLLFFLLVIMFVGCEDKHLYHTYYGNIDTDTMEVSFYDIKDSLPCYLIHTSDYDSVEVIPGEWRRVRGPIRYFYCPSKDVYYYSFPDNHDNRVVCAYDPITKELSNPDMK